MSCFNGGQVRGPVAGVCGAAAKLHSTASVKWQIICDAFIRPHRGGESDANASSRRSKKLYVRFDTVYLRFRGIHRRRKSHNHDGTKRPVRRLRCAERTLRPRIARRPAGRSRKQVRFGEPIDQAECLGLRALERARSRDEQRGPVRRPCDVMRPARSRI